MPAKYLEVTSLQRRHALDTGLIGESDCQPDPSFAQEWHGNNAKAADLKLAGNCCGRRTNKPVTRKPYNDLIVGDQSRLLLRFCDSVPRLVNEP